MSVTRTAISRIDGGFTKTDEGFLDVAVFPTKVGIFNYLRADGSVRRELRSREEVFKADSLRTLVNKPHTNDHPPQNLTSRNVKKHKTGHVYGAHEVHDDNIHTRSRLLVTDQDAIDDIEQKGKTPVSCGYTCDMDETPGSDPEFGDYDARQLNIRYNHLSSVWKARAGSGARITQDSDDDHVRFDAYEIDENNEIIKNEKGLPKMGKIRLDEVDFEVEQALEIAHKNQVKADVQALKDVQATADQEKARADKLEGERDALKAELEEAQKIDVAELVKARASLIADASKFVKDGKFDSLTDREIKEQVIKARMDWASTENKSDDYVNGLYESALKQGGKSVLDVYDSLPVDRSDVDTVDAIRKKQILELQGA